MTQARINLAPLIGNIQTELNSYLKANKAHLQKSLKEAKEFISDGHHEGFCYGYEVYPNNPEQYCYSSSMLTTQRALNIDLTIMALDHLKKGSAMFYEFSYNDKKLNKEEYLIKIELEEKINILQLNKDQADKVLAAIYELLQMSKANNICTSVHHHKNHKSYLQNVAAGSNSPWRETTWFQSRATKALERAEAMINNFKRNHPAYAPSQKRSIFSSLNPLILVQKTEVVEPGKENDGHRPPSPGAPK